MLDTPALFDPQANDPDKGRRTGHGQRAERILEVPLRGGIWSATLQITPLQAERLLAAMPPQRPMHSRNVEQFRRLLRSGEFLTTHQGIAFNALGELVDGQHRLRACADTGVAITVQATFNLPETAFAAMDRGQPRTLSDDLTVRLHTTGGSEGSILGAAIRILFNLQRGRVPWVSYVAPSLAEAEAVLAQYPTLLECCRFAKTHRKVGLPGSSMAAFHALFHTIDAAKADQLMWQIVKGESLREGDPAYSFRAFTERPGAKKLTHRAMAMVALVRTWNAHMEGRRLSRIDSSVRGFLDFPVIAGLRR